MTVRLSRRQEHRLVRACCIGDRSGLSRKTGLSARGKGGACPPKPSGAERNGIGTPKRRKKDESWRAVFRALVAGMHGTTCRVCGKPATDPHHVIREQDLRKRLPADGIEAVLADPRNGLSLCRLDHARHHARFAPIPRGLLSPCHFEFAEEYGLTWLLEKSYPEGPGVQA